MRTYIHGIDPSGMEQYLVRLTGTDEGAVHQ